MCIISLWFYLAPIIKCVLILPQLCLPFCLYHTYKFYGWWGHQTTGRHLNIKMSSYQYRDSHVKDKTVSPTVLSLTWKSPYLKKTVFILRRVLAPLRQGSVPHDRISTFRYKIEDSIHLNCSITLKHSMAVSLQGTMQNCKMIGQIRGGVTKAPFVDF